MDKSGVYSSEFWLTVASLVVSALVATGWVSAADASTIQGAIVQAASAAAALVSAAAVLWKYIESRKAIKVAAIAADAAPMPPK